MVREAARGSEPFTGNGSCYAPKRVRCRGCRELRPSPLGSCAESAPLAKGLEQLLDRPLRTGRGPRVAVRL
jgi:hypothetical protein